MKTALTLAMTALTAMTVACSAEVPEEKTGQTEEHFDRGCVSSITAPVGSPAWRAALQECIAADQPAGGDTAGGGGGTGCSVSVACINGSCTCGDGPKKGTACNGAIGSGATSCSEVCKVCN